MADETDEERDEEEDGEQDVNQYGGGDQDADAVEQTKRRGENDDEDGEDADED